MRPSFCEMEPYSFETTESLAMCDVAPPVRVCKVLEESSNLIDFLRYDTPGVSVSLINIMKLIRNFQLTD